VLLLHGLGVGGAIWQSFARRLTPHLAAIAPDMRGHGQSDAPPTGYLPADYARDLLALIEHEGQPVPVIGHSLGALVALQLAEGDPKRVPWIVLLDPPLDPGIRNTEVGSVSELRHAPPGELEAYLLDRNPGGGQLLAQSLAQLFRQASDEAFSTLRDPASRTFEHPERISQPVLLLQADPAHGGVLGDAAAQAFVGRVPHGRLLKIDGAPHALHASHPAEVANAILDFAGYGGEPGSSGSR
jgi:pimeloyl-ACP methyl ester carboxylesterase